MLKNLIARYEQKIVLKHMSPVLRCSQKRVDELFAERNQLFNDGRYSEYWEAYNLWIEAIYAHTRLEFAIDEITK